MRGLCQITLSLITCGFIVQSCSSLYAQSGPSEELHGFTPNSSDVLIKGTPLFVSADVTIHPSTLEAVTFISTITINKKRYEPFVTTLTRQTAAGGVAGSELMSWTTHVPGPKQISIRLQLEGVGQTSQSRFQFADITRDYSVSCNPKQFWLFRKIQQLFGSCS